jgi:hypothetical protein
LSRRLKLLPVLAFAAVTFAATSALADADAGATTHNCFHSRDWVGWKAPSPNVLLVKVGANGVWRLDLQQGSDQLKYPDVHITNRNMKSTWLCVPSDFNLLLSDTHGIVREPLIVTSVRQLTPEEIDAIPQRDRP